MKKLKLNLADLGKAVLSKDEMKQINGGGYGNYCVTDCMDNQYRMGSLYGPTCFTIQDCVVH
jgi:natural product precursor